MAFTDEALKAKLSTLNETQDSIVSVSQWIMFHKRHADRIANYWLTRLRDSPPAKRLNFIYLVNDIVQNARARRRSEFPDAFSPLMADAIQTAYRSSAPEIQNKIRRVVEVWRTRNVFEAPILTAIEARIDDIDKSKGSGGKKTLMGNSLFSSSSAAGLPKELETLAPLQIALTKETITARPAIDTAQTEYAKLNDPESVLPSPPVHAARLSSLLKALAAAESSVTASIQARRSLIADLERILNINKLALAKDEELSLELAGRKTTTEVKKREVEDGIIRGLASVEVALDSAPGARGATRSPGNGAGISDRPEIEELTPDREFPDIDFSHLEPQSHPDFPTSHADSARSGNPAVAAALAGFSASEDDVPSNIAVGGLERLGSAAHTAAPNRARSSSGGAGGLNGFSSKRRKTSHGEQDAVPDLGAMGMEDFGYENLAVFDGQMPEVDQNDFLKSLDEDVDELLRQERGDF